MTKEKKAVLKATTIVAKEIVVICPYCHEEDGGWCADPRGTTAECEHCGETYQVHHEADVEYY